MRQEARILKDKAIHSFKRAATAFNSLQDNGDRSTDVLLATQHSFEMLLKAALVQKKVPVFDRDNDKSIGFNKCIHLGREKLKITDAEAGALRAIDSLRDAEQHWYCLVAEGLLYTHMRAAVTLFDGILRRAFNQPLADHMPERVLPISTLPPQDIQSLIDDEYSQIQQLLKPGKRRGAEARGRIRTLLALQAHTGDDIEVGEHDVERAEEAIRNNKPRQEVLPNLATVGTSITGEGINVTVHFTRTDGAPVRYVSAEDDAAGIKVADMLTRYHWTRSKLAEKLGLSAEKACALRWHLDIDRDNACYWRSPNRSTVDGYSDVAYRKIKEALTSSGFDLTQVLKDYRLHRRQS